MNYFELFEQPAVFDIDRHALKQTFLALQKRHHPDAANRLDSLSGDVLNHAFDILTCDDKRAIYLLELQGVHLNLDATTQDREFLTQMMALRMDLEDAKQASDKDAIAQLKNTISTLQADTAQAFASCFATKDWQKASDLALNLRFLARLSQAVTETAVYHDDTPDELYV